MKTIINQIYTLNTKLPIKSMWKPVFIAKNMEVLKIIVIFENEHDKNWSRMSIIGQFLVWKMSKMSILAFKEAKKLD